MGYWRSLQGRFEPGICYQRAIEAKEKVEGKTIAVAALLNFIGMLLHDMAIYPSALPFKERALEIHEKALGPDHLNTEICRDNLKACKEAMR